MQQLIVKYSDNLEEGEVVARPIETVTPEILEVHAKENLPDPLYITKDGQYWASAKTGELVGISGYERR